MQPHPSFVAGIGTARVELVLRDADGSPWSLTVSPGMERFIGRYPRIDGIGCGGALLCFRSL